MTQSKQKKQGWEYAQEARKAKKAAASDHVAPSGKKVNVSTPETDFNAGVILVNFEKRAGIKTYADELKERLQDVSEAPDGCYYLLPAKLPRNVYKMLLSQAYDIASSVSPEWTERDMLEAMVLFSETKLLTDKKGQA